MRAAKALLEEALSKVRSVAGSINAECLRTEDAEVLMKISIEIEKAVSAVKLVVAPRVEEGQGWSKDGHKSAASWLAQSSGTSLGEAISMMDTARRLRSLHATEQAVRRGEISEAEAACVASASSKDPRAERALLENAKRHNLKELKERSRAVKREAASQRDEVEREAEIHKARYLRHFCDEDGAFRFEARLTQEAGARIAAAIDKETSRVFEESRQAGLHESRSAYRADALVSLVTSSGRAKARKDADVVHLHVHEAALRRGWAKADERCEIAGVGHVSVKTAQRIFGDSFLKILIEDAVDIKSVCHIGRTIPISVRSALEARDPVCVVPSCGAAGGLEIHHWKEPFAVSRSSTLDGLARICRYHHDLVTYRDYELVGGPGRWKLLSPNRPANPDVHGQQLFNNVRGSPALARSG